VALVSAAIDIGNAQHIGGRRDQQDSFGFSTVADAGFVAHGGIAAVLADGMGGLAHGDLASRTAVQAFLLHYQLKTTAETIPQALARSLAAANDAVIALGPEGELGATLIAAVVDGYHLHWITVGDSALTLFQGGQFHLLAELHTYASELDARASRGEITTAAALADPQREALSSYLGQRRLERVERSAAPLALRPGDRVLLASDGIFRTLTAAEMAAAMAGSAQESCEALLAQVLEKGVPGQDNATAILLSICAPQVAVATAVSRPRRLSPPVGRLLAAGAALSLGAAAVWVLAQLPPPPPPAGALAKPASVGAAPLPPDAGPRKPSPDDETDETP
jgi:protein phosphatase